MARSCLFWFSTLLLCILAGPSHAATITIGQYSLHAPDAVGEGLPFLVEIESPQPFAQATVLWNETRLVVFPAQQTGRQQFIATAMLGMELKTPQSPEELPLVVTLPAANTPIRFTAAIRRVARPFPEQSLKVDSQFVALSKDDLTRHRRERQVVRAALDTTTPRRYWECPLFRPVQGDVSSAFGLRRLFNGQPRQPHRGVDLRAQFGQRVAAAFGGRVLLAVEHFFSGKTLYLDHGEGVVTMYMHLSEIMVSQGQRVTKGQTIGRIGATGRVTGPHLHFGMSILGGLVDPLAVNEFACLRHPVASP